MSIISESEDIATMTINHYERILRERDEARKEIAFLWDERDQARVELLLKQQTCEQLERDLAEARESNAKIISIAERAIDDLRWFYEGKSDGILSELEELKKQIK